MNRRRLSPNQHPLDYFHGTLDPFVISHEVGHIVDAEIRAQTGYGGDDFPISEGTANILACDQAPDVADRLRNAYEERGLHLSAPEC